MENNLKSKLIREEQYEFPDRYYHVERFSYCDVEKAVLEFENFVKESIKNNDMMGSQPDIKLIMLNFREIFGDFTNN